jgi:photosystem II stability/assembly factor-like uncharacterized protein
MVFVALVEAVGCGNAFPELTERNQTGMRLRDIGSKRGERRESGRFTARFGRWTLVAAFALAAATLLPLTASGYLSTSPTGGGSWFWQNPLPQGNDFRAMSWISSDLGYAFGITGTALKTTDGGHTWLALRSGTNRDLTGASFVDTNTGWVSGTAATMLHTTDGGATWVAQTVPSTGGTRNLRAVSFWNSSIGVAVGEQGATTSTIVYTSDGGATWRSGSTTSTANLSDVRMVSATTGVAVGAAGTILKTTDGGATWAPQSSPTAAGLTGVSFAPGGTVGYLVGNAVWPTWTLYKTTDGGATWSGVTGLGTTDAINLTGVSCMNANNAIAVGNSGQIRHTTDGGVTWLSQSENNVGSNSLRAVTMVDANNIKVVGDFGMIFTTSNGGVFWTTPFDAVASTFQNCSFTDVNHGWAVGSNGTILRTTDAGVTWVSQASGSTFWRGVHFVDANNGWVVGDGGAILHSTDGGISWTPQTSGTTAQLNSVHFLDVSNGYAVGAGGKLLKTSDGGVNWTSKSSGTTNNLNSVWMANTQWGWAVGDGGVVTYTHSNGNNWNTQTSGTTQNLLTVRGIDASNVWAAGNGGTMIKTTSGGGSWAALSPGAGTSPIRTVFFVDASTGWFAGNNGFVKKTTDGGATWVQQNAGIPTAALDPAVNVYSSWFFASGAGYLVGDTGLIRRTLDSGASWTSQQYGTQNWLNTVGFTADQQNGWIGGAGGFMFNSSNGGQSWAVQRTGTNSAVNAVSVVSSQTIWADGDNGMIRKSTDGGRTWTGQASGATANFRGISAVNASYAVACGQGGLIKYTQDGGSNWATGSIGTAQQINSVSMVSTSTGYAVATRVAGSNVVWHTTDGGATWASQATTANANLWAVYFRTPTVGYAVGDSGIVLKTTDAGATWVTMPTPTTLAIYGIQFSDANNGVAVGFGGLVMRTSDGGATWAVQSSGTERALYDVSFGGGGIAFAVGGQATVLRSGNLSAPTTTLLATPPTPDGSNNWYKTGPSVQLVADKPGTTYYSWASISGPFTTYAGTFSAPQGTQTVYYYSVDASGSAEAVRNAVFSVDYTPPTASNFVTATSITTTSAVVYWTAGTDSVSGVDRYDVYLNGTYAASALSTSTALSGLTPNTSYAVTVKTIDAAGNASPSSLPANFLSGDNWSLVTTTTVVPVSPNGSSGWYVTTPTVSFAVTPTVPAWTHYAWDSSALSTYSAPAAVPSNGSHTLSFWSVDQAAMRSQESTKTLSLKLDTSAPSSSIVTVTPTSPTSLDVSWTAAVDADSGIAYYTFYLDGSAGATTTATSRTVGGLSVNTTHSVQVRASNGAGLQSSMSSTVTAKTLTDAAVYTGVSVSPAAPNANGWYSAVPTVTLTPLPTSVVARQAFYSWDSDAVTTYTVPVAVPSDGVHTLSYLTIDRDDPLGNRETTRTLTLSLDTSPPVPPASVYAQSLDTTTVAVSWTLGSDASSGVEHYDLYVDNVYSRSVAATSISVTGLVPNSIHTFAVAAVDRAGFASVQSPSVVGAAAAESPLLTNATPSAAPTGADGWYTTTPTITFSISPNVAAWTHYAWDSSGLTTGTGTTPSAGAYTLSYWSVDQAGERADEATRQAVFKLDTTAPSAPVDLLASGDSTNSVAISWNGDRCRVRHRPLRAVPR